MTLTPTAELYTDETLVAHVQETYGADWQLVAIVNYREARYYTFRASDGSPMVRSVRWSDHADALVGPHDTDADAEFDALGNRNEVGR